MHERKQRSMLHATRKFFNTQLNVARVHPNSISKMMGHKGSLRDLYYRPDNGTLFDEYKLAIPYLSISEKYRSQFQVEKLEEKKEDLENKLKMSELENNIHKMENNMDSKFSELENSMKSFLSDISKSLNGKN